MRESKILSVIRTDGGTQSRAGLNEEKVQEYQERIEAGDQLPALEAVYDGTNYWLWDGFHRHAAALRAGKTMYLVDVRQGTRRDAVRLACGANAKHGLPRTPDDKRRAVQTMLEDEEWGTWSDRKIAEACVVSPTLVGKVRGSLTVHVDSESQERTYITRHGTTATMNTANIGRVGDPGPLAKAIEASVDAAAYEEIRSLQNFILIWISSVYPDLPHRIELIADMSTENQHGRWSDLQLALARAGKVFRANDLRQALNNVLDILRQGQAATAARQAATQSAVSQPSEPAQDSEHTTTCPMCSGECEVKDTSYRSESGELRTLTLYCPQCLATMQFGRNYPNDPIDWQAPLLLNVRWDRSVQGATPPEGWIAYKPHTNKCPHCKSGPHQSYGPAIWTAPIVAQWQAEYDALLNAWQAKKLSREGTDEPRPYDNRIRDHWSKVTPGKCDCGATYWADFRGNSYYLPSEEQTQPVLNSEQAAPPKPRIAPYVMAHFQTANEALSRIYTAIPKSREDDIHDFATLIASLERLERRIGQEYELR